MKIIFAALVAFMFISIANAKDPDSHTLKVEILNLGVNDCYLTKSEIISGHLTGVIPGKLPGTGLVLQFKLSNKPTGTNAGAFVDGEFSLTYQCGPDKQFTIYTKQYYKKGHYHGQINATMNSSYVYETHEISAPERSFGSHSNSKKGSIRWSIWN